MHDEKEGKERVQLWGVVGGDTHRPSLHPTAQVGHRHTEPNLPAHRSARDEEDIQRPADFYTIHRPACSLEHSLHLNMRVRDKHLPSCHTAFTEDGHTGGGVVSVSYVASLQWELP